MQATKVTRPKVDWNDFLPAVIVVLNSLVWYTLTYSMFSSVVNNLKVPASITLTLFSVYYIAIACSGIFGAMLSPRRRETFLAVWMFVGAVMTLLLITIPRNDFPINILVSLFLGIVAGIGLPSCLACFADATVVENRGIYGGMIWGAIGSGILALALLINTFDLIVAFATLALWRLFGSVAFVFSTRKKKKTRPVRDPSSFSFILHRREVVLYLLPWIMFSLVNFVEVPIVERVFGDFAVIAEFIEFAITGLFAVVGGLLADLVGRKRVVMTGFIVLGVGYAALSLFSEMPVVWYLFTTLDGIAWGMFASVFFMTLWGDLAGEYQRERYYVLGGIPYFLAGFLPVIIQPYAGMIQTVTAFSLASFFLFLAVLPLMYAPETLPEKTMRQRELDRYVQDAKKFKDKSERKE
jgi:MFS family permease